MSDRWWTDGAMVNGGESGDEHFVGDAATADDAERIVTAHNATVPSHVHVPGSEWEAPELIARREGYDQGFRAARLACERLPRLIEEGGTQEWDPRKPTRYA